MDTLKPINEPYSTQKAYRERHPERVKEIQRKSRIKRADKIRAYRKSPEGKAKQREYQRTYRRRHKDDPKRPQTSRREYHRKYNERNREKKRLSWRKFYRKNIEKEKERRRLKTANGDQRRYLKAYRERNKNNPHMKIRSNLSLRVRNALNSSDIRKTQKTMDLIGCSIESYKRYLESLFQPGMTWENYGVWREGQPMKWQIDHIKPCDSFDLVDPIQQKACFHYPNTQPLWASENARKGASLNWPKTNNPHHC